MLTLEGNNLGERHRYLNFKVKEAVEMQHNFDELKFQSEKPDIDKIFKIDLASNYKNIEYILEVLKSGDAFLITRALKCLWLYDDHYSQFINTSYIDSNIFPFMSMKMKRKMLTSISLHVRSAERAIQFFHYCKKGKMNEYALKFVFFTPEKFKFDLMENEAHLLRFRDTKTLKQFIGDSFELSQAYMKMHNNSRDVMHKLRYLCSVSDEKYLNLFEKIIDVAPENCDDIKRLGIRLSRNILISHKQRIFKYPLLYINTLNKTMLAKYLTIDDVRSLGFALLPATSDYFWSINFYNSYKSILEKLPSNEIYPYLKQLYTSRYEGEFDMRIEFYKLRYYEMLSLEEREDWALRLIERDDDMPEIENFMWYKFVSCDKAISQIQRFIFLTPDGDKRSRIINILPETTRSQEDLIKVLKYYYQRHVNENEEYKDSFINEIIKRNDIFSFNSECWTLLDQLFYSLDVYSSAPDVRVSYKAISMIYHILHEENMPEGLKEYIGCNQFYNIAELIQKLSDDNKYMVAMYLIDPHVDKLESLNVEDEEERQRQIDIIVYNISHVIQCFHIPEEDIPETVLKHINPDTFYKPSKFIPKTEGDFIRWLKKDVQMVRDGLDEIRCNSYRRLFRLTRLFRKLKVYFPNDVGIEYLEYFMNYLSDLPTGRREYRNIKMSVVGVFYLGDETIINHFLDKYVPVSPKIDYINIDKTVFQIQKAICRLAYHTRPPIPLSSIKKYITGDYTQFCLPIFNNYVTNLPSSREFIECLLDNPLSIQKHGLRFALRTYSPVNLKPIIITAWKRTENVSLRMILYQKLFERILKDNEQAQKELYEILKLFTGELNHDDHANVYSLLVSDDLPDAFKGDFIETAWLTVSKLSNKTVDKERRISVVRHMERHIHCVQREFLRCQIINDHVDAFNEESFDTDHDYYTRKLIESKWDLTAKYIVNYNDTKEQQQSLNLLRTIINKCLSFWMFVNDDEYAVRKFFLNFMKSLKNKSPKTRERWVCLVPVYQCILDNLQKYLKTDNVYLITLELTFLITCKQIIHQGINKGSNIGEIPISSDEMAYEYGKAVGMLVKNLKEKDKFYHCFYNSIANIISEIGNTFCEVVSMDRKGFVYNVCNGLTEIKMKETYIIALKMLPQDPICDRTNEHARLLTKIQQFEGDSSIPYFVHDKYVQSDYSIRSYIL